MQHSELTDDILHKSKVDDPILLKIKSGLYNSFLRRFFAYSIQKREQVYIYIYIFYIYYHYSYFFVLSFDFEIVIIFFFLLFFFSIFSLKK